MGCQQTGHLEASTHKGLTTFIFNRCVIVYLLYIDIQEKIRTGLPYKRSDTTQKMGFIEVVFTVILVIALCYLFSIIFGFFLQACPCHYISRVLPSEKTDKDKAATFFSKKECGICLDTFENNHIACKNCGNKFHKTCMNNWVERHNTCPNCRAQWIVF